MPDETIHLAPKQLEVLRGIQVAMEQASGTRWVFREVFDLVLEAGIENSPIPQTSETKGFDQGEFDRYA